MSEQNYLVSGRSMHALYYIDPQGQIIWQLGGVENDFTGDDDWQFGWQHHASFVSSISTEEERCISVSPLICKCVDNAKTLYRSSTTVPMASPS